MRKGCGKQKDTLKHTKINIHTQCHGVHRVRSHKCVRKFGREVIPRCYTHISVLFGFHIVCTLYSCFSNQT